MSHGLDPSSARNRLELLLGIAEPVLLPLPMLDRAVVAEITAAAEALPSVRSAAQTAQEVITLLQEKILPLTCWLLTIRLSDDDRRLQMMVLPTVDSISQLFIRPHQTNPVSVSVVSLRRHMMITRINALRHDAGDTGAPQPLMLTVSNLGRGSTVQGSMPMFVRAFTLLARQNQRMFEEWHDQMVELIERGHDLSVVRVLNDIIIRLLGTLTAEGFEGLNQMMADETIEQSVPATEPVIELESTREECPCEVQAG